MYPGTSRNSRSVASSLPPPSSPPPVSNVKKPRNRFEEAMYRQLDPDLAARVIGTDEEIDEFLLEFGGWGPEDLEQGRAWLHAKYDACVDKNGHVNIRGGKPRPGETENVHLIPIPDTGDLAIRFFDGGLKDEMMWALDFYDIKNRKAVNTPPGFSINIIPVPSTASMMFSGPLSSWEVNLGIKQQDIVVGEERFNMPEGCLCALTRPGQEPFYFEAPRRTWTSSVPIATAIPASAL